MFRSRKAEPQSRRSSAAFHGVWAAAVTPHRREGYEADFASMLELVDRLSQAGVDGIVLLGATGEFLNIKLDERQRLVHLAVKRSRVPIIAGVSHSTLDGAVQLADAAVDSGAAGVLLMPPYFYRYGDAELLEFYRVFAVAVGGALPILLYHIPAFTNAISPDVARELLAGGEFAGIKDSSGDPAYMERLAALRRENDFSLLCGNDRLIVHSHRAGCDGTVSGIAGAVPELILALNQALTNANESEVHTLEQHLLEFTQWLDRFPVPIGISAAAEARGIKVGPPALPLTSDQFDLLEEFKSWFKNWLPAIEKLPYARSPRR
jgi:dihydrodipicolinate synthase/N-acetylneuraminate lyase